MCARNCTPSELKKSNRRNETESGVERREKTQLKFGREPSSLNVLNDTHWAVVKSARFEIGQNSIQLLYIRYISLFFLTMFAIIYSYETGSQPITWELYYFSLYQDIESGQHSIQLNWSCVIWGHVIQLKEATEMWKFQRTACSNNVIIRSQWSNYLQMRLVLLDRTLMRIGTFILPIPRETHVTNPSLTTKLINTTTCMCAGL